jgi:predicted permease
VRFLLAEVRHAIRSLARRPVFLGGAVATLAIGIGATTAVFTLVHAILLRPMPGRDPDRLVNVHRTEPDGTSFHGFSNPSFLDLRRGTRRLEGLAAFTGRFASLRVGSEAQPVAAQIVSENYFRVLGVSPAVGRAFGPGEARAGAASAALVSDRLWRTRFAADPELLGKTITVNGHPFAVIGILPPGFEGTFIGFRFDLWLPLARAAETAPGLDLEDRGDDSLELIGRLAAGVSRREAQAELGALATRLARDHPNENRGMGVDVRKATPVDDSLRGVITTLLTLLTAVSGLVLLVACINVSGLLQARNLARSREFAVRRAIGAGRGDLARLSLAETLPLFAAGSAAGFLASFGICRLLAAFTPRFGFALDLDLRPDLRSLGFAAAAAGLCALFFVLLPTFARAPQEIAAVLREGGGAARPLRARRFFVTVQLAISTLLLVVAGLLVRSAGAIRQTEPGFDASHVRIGTVNLALIGTESGARVGFYRELRRRMEGVPGVESVGLARRVPVGSIGRATERVAIPGRDPLGPDGFVAEANTVSPGFFRTLRVPVLAGRDFDDRDSPEAMPAVVVNETLASRLWPGDAAVGKSLRSAAGTTVVVGVVANGKYNSLAEPSRPAIYFPVDQRFSARMTVFLRGSGASADLTGALRREVSEMNPDLPVLDTVALSDFLAVSSLPQRMAGSVTSALGLLGLILASIGLYGLLAYEVRQRGREIGIRIALGASPAAVTSLFLRRGGTLAARGMGVGLAIAFAASRLVEGLLFGVGSRDPLVFGLVAAFLSAVALAAAYVPARRGARLDAIVALRQDA